MLRLRKKYSGRGGRAWRLADRYFGVPLVATIGALRRKRPMPCRIDRVGLLTTAAIGDTILISAIVADLRAAFPSASIIFFAGDSNYAAACLIPHCDTVVRLPVRRPFKASRIVRAHKLDLLLDLGPWARLNALLAALGGASCTLGFRTPGQHRHFAYDLAVDHSPRVHEMENLRRMVAALGIPARHQPAIDRDKLPQDPGVGVAPPFVVLHLWPGGTCSDLKQWPLDRWRRLAAYFAARKLTVILTGAASQHATNDAVIQAANPELQSNLQSMIRNAAGLSLAQTAAMLARADLVVSVDTGVMHLAAALGVPLVGLCGPASSDRWGPIGARAEAVDSPLRQCGYLYLGFERPRDPPRCMEAIPFEAVLARCISALNDGGDRCADPARRRPMVGGAHPDA